LTTFEVLCGAPTSAGNQTWRFDVVGATPCHGCHFIIASVTALGGLHGLDKGTDPSPCGLLMCFVGFFHFLGSIFALLIGSTALLGQTSLWMDT